MTEPEAIPVSIGRIPGEPFAVLPGYDENDQRERICEPMSEPNEPEQDVEEIDLSNEEGIAPPPQGDGHESVLADDEEQD